MGGDHSTSSTSLSSSTQLTTIHPQTEMSRGFFAGAVFNGSVTFNFGSSGMNLSEILPQPLLPNPLAKAPGDFIPQEISHPVQLLLTDKPPPEAVNEIDTGILFTVDLPNSESEIEFEGEERSPRVSFSPNPELEVESEDEEISLTQPRVSFSQMVRELPPKRSRVHYQKNS